MIRAFDDSAYIMWYHKIFGSSKKGKKALAYYGGDYFELYNALYEEYDDSGIVKGMPPRKFKDYSPLDGRELIFECEEYGWKVVTCLSDEYPKELLETDSYPHILFCDGDIGILNRSVKIAVIGSREAKSEAEVVARNAAFNLAKTGAVIVSGAALGIDSCAHLGAIEAGGDTVGVLGCGLGSSYLDRLGDFYCEVKKHGVYITEMFPFENPTKYSFPERNRLISGLSRGVLVACAAEKSGSLKTCELARKQERRVYAVAPEICYSPGCKKLIDEGAYTFYNAGDIAYPLKDFYPEGVFNEAYCNKSIAAASSSYTAKDMSIPKKAAKKTPVKKTEKKTAVSVPQPQVSQEKPVRNLPDYLSDNAKKIYSLLGEEPVIIDELVSRTGLRINQILISVSELETEQLIKNLPGSRIEKV